MTALLCEALMVGVMSSADEDLMESLMQISNAIATRFNRSR